MLFGKNKTPAYGYWIKKEHMFGEIEYFCSVCRKQSDEPYVKCPHCGVLMTKIKSDPVWVDEMEFYDVDDD